MLARPRIQPCNFGPKFSYSKAAPRWAREEESAVFSAHATVWYTVIWDRLSHTQKCKVVVLSPLPACPALGRELETSDEAHLLPVGTRANSVGVIVCAEGAMSKKQILAPIGLRERLQPRY